MNRQKTFLLSLAVALAVIFGIDPGTGAVRAHKGFKT